MPSIKELQDESLANVQQLLEDAARVSAVIQANQGMHQDDQGNIIDADGILELLITWTIDADLASMEADSDSDKLHRALFNGYIDFRNPSEMISAIAQWLGYYDYFDVFKDSLILPSSMFNSK